MILIDHKLTIFNEWVDNRKAAGGLDILDLTYKDSKNYLNFTIISIIDRTLNTKEFERDDYILAISIISSKKVFKKDIKTFYAKLIIRLRKLMQDNYARKKREQGA